MKNMDTLLIQIFKQMFFLSVVFKKQIHFFREQDL